MMPSIIARKRRPKCISVVKALVATVSTRLVDLACTTLRLLPVQRMC